MAKTPLGIYVHTPYCLKKCNYCDFKSFAAEPDPDYFEQLCKETAGFAKKYANKYYVDTVYFGGGTPSMMDAPLLASVLNAIRESFELTGFCEITSCEITIEANPETLTEEKLKALSDIGFNRISIGVQSFDDGLLKTLGRVHSAERAREALGAAKKYFKNLNIDLMLGLPGQNLEIWQSSLEEALSFNPQHISFYSLQLEENTPLYESYKNGEIELPAWEENRRMYHFAIAMLKEAGYNHYEISNAAFPGFECRHNIKYWTMQDYLGLGLGAHSFIEGYRLECTEEGLIKSPQTQKDLKGDFIFTQLRLVEGFELKDYGERFGRSFIDEFKMPLAGLFDAGLLERTADGRLKLTACGLDNTNLIIKNLLYALEE